MVAQIKNLSVGESVSYGQTWFATRKTKIAVIPVGYSDGYDRRLSNIGRVIINGHYDDSSARPAAFWQLKNVAVGDKVSVTDKYSKTFVYQVSDVFFVSIQDPQRLDVLQSDDSKSTITLITCGGVWLPGMSTYDKRLVVKGELVFADSEIM